MKLMLKNKHQSTSIHPTLDGSLKVNWEQEYQGEFICTRCEQGKQFGLNYDSKAICKLVLRCKLCQNRVSLTCRVPAKIFNYLSHVECPNSLCTQIGKNGQKGWVYQSCKLLCKCYFCGILFTDKSTRFNSWAGSQSEDKPKPFCFEDDIWDMRHFYDKLSSKTIDFTSIQPEWYQLQFKHYFHHLLKLRKYSSFDAIRVPLKTLRHFGKTIEQIKVQGPTEITREVILTYLDVCRTLAAGTISCKLSNLKNFLEWLGLEVSHLIRCRDYPKLSINETDWLDEVTRVVIKQQLQKVFAPIARQYLVQEYTAARVGDVCQITLNCLVEDNGRWYVKFYQNKPERWHQLPVSREIRQVIEEQQQWIRQTIGPDYSYLFCHFRNIRQESYPAFLNIKPLPKPPQVESDKNPMVRIIRMLIVQENISDANGQQPHFTGKITRSSRLQEMRVKHGLQAAQLYADHIHSQTTFQHYAYPTPEQVAQVDLPFQALLINPNNKFLAWQSLPESLLKNPKAHELDMEIAPRLVVYGHCTLDPKTPCPINLYPKCYGCSSFRPSTSKLLLYEQQYAGEYERMQTAQGAGAELAYEEAKTTIEAMDKWLPELKKLANGDKA